MREKLNYRVTEKAPIEVAGRRVKAGDVLQLTEPVARYEVLQGFLVPFDDTVEAASQGGSKAPAKKTAKAKAEPAGDAGAAG